VSLFDEPLTTRRRHVEQLLRENPHPCLQLMEQTAEIGVTQDWLALLGMIEGVVAKRADSPTTLGGGENGSKSSVIGRPTAW